MPTQDKPTVRYAGPAELHMWPHIGMVARLYAVDHPRLGAGHVRTSRIIQVDVNTGMIETSNTLYVPEK